MSLRKDKKKVLGETFDDERIKGFLNRTAPAGVALDYHLLENAYRGMHEENFSTFLKFFVAAGFNINTQSPQGKTFLDTIKEHRSSQAYEQLVEHLNSNA